MIKKNDEKPFKKIKTHDINFGSRKSASPQK
jgi:hypothetical protein